MQRRPGFLRSGASLAVAVILVIIALPLATRLSGVLGALGNPFKTEHREVVQPPVLKSLQDLSEYHAATANLDAVVSASDEAAYVPSFIKGTDTTFLATGSVDAIVDFRTLGAGAIVASPDAKRVTVTLPSPRLGTAQLDLNRSKVLSNSRGLLDRVGDIFSGDPGNRDDVYRLGQQALQDAATQTELLQRAKDNTTATLTGMLKGLGYEQVTIVFQDPPAPPQ